MDRKTPWALASIAVTLGLTACSETPVPRRDGGGNTGHDGGDVGEGGVDAYVAVDGAPPPIDVGTDTGPIDREAFCMGEGPAVIVGDHTMGTATCAGSIATRVFTNAVCTCNNLTAGGYVKTRSYDSGLPGTGDDEVGGPVGVNNTYSSVGYTDIGGSFTVAGSSALQFAGYLEVGGDAKFGGAVGTVGYIDVQRDLWINGAATVIGKTESGRDFYMPPGIGFPLWREVGGSERSTAFTVPPPCACAAGDIVNIASIVATARTMNDNADIGLSPDALAAVFGFDEDIELPCGRFYLSRINAGGGVHLQVNGRTALFIDGDVNAVGYFDIDIGPDGELDMFIAGSLTSIGLGSFGDEDRAARTRIYIGGTGDVNIVGVSKFVGNVYAPNAHIRVVGYIPVHGSLFGQNVSAGGDLDVRYDRQILEVDRECPPPATCGECGVGPRCVNHQSCMGGECVACASDADCCAPLVCYPDGTCGALIL